MWDKEGWTSRQLCFKCNAQKRDRDDTDFAAVKASYEDRKSDCPFCTLPKERIIDENELAVAILDGYPVKGSSAP